MVDRFLREVQRMHQLRQDINEMTPEEADELIRGLGDDAAEDWVFAARDAQLPPPELDWCWLFLGGRGAGKSHSMSAAVHTAVRAGIKRIHFIAPTTTDFHDVNIEGKSGIFATCGRDPRPRWVTSRRRLEWPDGAMCVFFSGEEPESLRGPQCELCIIDEIGRISSRARLTIAVSISSGILFQIRRGLGFFLTRLQELLRPTVVQAAAGTDAVMVVDDPLLRPAPSCSCWGDGRSCPLAHVGSPPPRRHAHALTRSRSAWRSEQSRRARTK
jgi:hypothetical protein